MIQKFSFNPEKILSDIKQGKANYGGITFKVLDSQKTQYSPEGWTVIHGLEFKAVDSTLFAALWNYNKMVKRSVDGVLEKICQAKNIDLVIVDDFYFNSYLKFDTTGIAELVLEEIYSADISLVQLLDVATESHVIECRGRQVGKLNKMFPNILKHIKNKKTDLQDPKEIETAILKEYGTRKEAIKALYLLGQERGNFKK